MRNLTTLRKGLLPPQSMPVRMVLSVREKSNSPPVCFNPITHQILNLLKTSLKRLRRIPRQILTNLKTLQIPTTTKEGAFRRNTNKIIFTDNQFHWTSLKGGWKTYNYDGYLLQYGTEDISEITRLSKEEIDKL